MNIKHPVLFAFCLFVFTLQMRGNHFINDSPIVVEVKDNFSTENGHGSMAVTVRGGVGNIKVQIINSNGADIIQLKREFTLENLEGGYYILVVTDEAHHISTTHIKLGIE